MQKTKTIKPGDNKIEWYLIDAKGMNLGQLSVKIAKLLIGKSKVTYAPNLFSGDNVVVINSKNIKADEKKSESKLYHRHSGYPGGLKTLSLGKMMKKNPSVVIKHAVKGMVPKNKLGDVIMSHLYVYNDEVNPHEAQKPIKID